MPSSFPSASIILRADQAKIDQQIRDSVLTLGKNQWRAEVLLVDPAIGANSQSENDLTQRVRCRPVPKSFATLGQAILAAKHPTIAIADAGFAINSNNWQFVVNRTKTYPIQTFFFRHQPRKRPKQCLIWLYSCFVRFLFGLRKHEFTQGLTLIQRDALPAELKNPNPDSTAAWELLSGYRLNRQPISEVEVEPTPENQTFSLGRIRSKSIYAAFGVAFCYWWNQIMFPRRQAELPKKKYKSKEKLATTLVLLGIGCFIFLTTLNFPLFEPDEARNSQLALNVLETGEWMSLKLQDESYWDKPPLQIWAIAASYSLFGENQFATRLPVAMASLLTLMLTLLLGKRLVGFRPAAIGTVLLMMSCGFVLCGRYVTMDATLTAMVTMMLLSGYLAVRDRFDKKSAIIAGIACGFGFLVKGPVICVLAVPPLIVAAWLARSATTANQKSPSPFTQLIWFAAPAILIAAPWFIATAIIHPDFLGYFFWKHHVVRFSNAFNHREPFWYYLIGIFVFMFPASYLLPSAFKFMTSRKPENRLVRTREQGFLLLSAVWVIGFFTLSESKLPTYIIPSFPLICLMMGVLVEQKILVRSVNSADSASGRKRTYLQHVQRRAPWNMAFWTAIACVSLIAFFEIQIGTAIAIATIIAVATVMVTLSLRNTERPKLAWSCFGIVGLLLVSLIAHQLIPAVSTTRSIHRAAKSIQSDAEFGFAPIVFFGREAYGAGLNWDLERVFHFEASQSSAVAEFLLQNPHAILVSSKDPMKALRSDLPWTIELEEYKEARHLYLSRPNQTVIAREQASRLYR